ncbi:hypothetical protein RI367_002062 [Sorochytrium milnesiophthora]
MALTSKIRSIIRKVSMVKSVDKMQAETEASQLKRELGALDVTLIGIGMIIGVGIFVMTGEAAGKYAGPAVVVSFLLASIACGLAGLCYAELAAMIPASGSAYSYAYATVGEYVAWLIGWNLVLEYVLGGATVAAGWSGYLLQLLEACNVHPSETLLSAPVRWDSHIESFVKGSGYLNLPAILVVVLATIVLCVGVKESTRFNHVFVAIKTLVIVLFLIVSYTKLEPKNWQPFFIPRDEVHNRYGAQGVLRAVSYVFIAYIGFDAVATTAQETRNPARDMPIGILGSLLICTLLYVMVALNLTGVRHYSQFEQSHAPLAEAVAQWDMKWLSISISIGALAGLTSAVTVNLMAMPRILYSMAQDGLLPPVFARLHPKYNTPVFPTVACGLICAVAAGFLPLGILGELTSMGTLFAFTLVCISVSVLRFTRPDLKRRFRVPFGPILIPALGAVLCITIIVTSNPMGWAGLAGWMVVGTIVYAVYGFRHSRLREPLTKSELIAQQ